MPGRAVWDRARMRLASYGSLGPRHVSTLAARACRLSSADIRSASVVVGVRRYASSGAESSPYRGRNLPRSPGMATPGRERYDRARSPAAHRALSPAPSGRFSSRSSCRTAPEARGGRNARRVARRRALSVGPLVGLTGRVRSGPSTARLHTGLLQQFAEAGTFRRVRHSRRGAAGCAARPLRRV